MQEFLQELITVHSSDRPILSQGFPNPCELQKLWGHAEIEPRFPFVSLMFFCKSFLDIICPFLFRKQTLRCLDTQLQQTITTSAIIKAWNSKRDKMPLRILHQFVYINRPRSLCNWQGDLAATLTCAGTTTNKNCCASWYFSFLHGYFATTRCDCSRCCTWVIESSFSFCHRLQRAGIYLTGVVNMRQPSYHCESIP